MSNEIETTNQLFAATKTQLEAAAEIIGGSAWGADKGKPRIYMRSGRDRKVYFAFPDYPTGDPADVLGGAKLCIFIDDCGQHPNWYAGQRAKIFQRMYQPALALDALHAGAEDLAREIMEDDREFTPALVDEISGHLINGRIDEARAALCA